MNSLSHQPCAIASAAALVPARARDYAQLQWTSCAVDCRVPLCWRSWLLDRRSLTAQLRRLSGGDFAVQLRSQTIAVPNRSEQRQLRLAPRQRAMIREVVLTGGGSAWVFARTVVPLSTLVGPLRQLRRLGGQPLGEALFAQPSLRRSGFEIADCRHWSGEAPAHWGRRSRFTVAGRPLLVAEIFLDPFAERAFTSARQSQPR